MVQQTRLHSSGQTVEVRDRAKVRQNLDLTQLLDRRPALAVGWSAPAACAWAARSCAVPRRIPDGRAVVNLDAKLRVQMRTEIARLPGVWGHHRLYVTHDQTEAMTLGDRVVVMLTGVVSRSAPRKRLYNRPVNLFVAGFSTSAHRRDELLQPRSPTSVLIYAVR